MMSLSDSISDDRGVNHPIPTPPARKRGEDLPPLEERRRLRLALTMARSPVRMAGASILMLALGIAMIAAALRADSNAGVEVAAAGLLVAVMGVGTPLTILRRRTRYRARLAELPPMCAACGCDMAGVYPERDGCAVCPRCRAAWRFGGAAVAEG